LAPPAGQSSPQDSLAFSGFLAPETRSQPEGVVSLPLALSEPSPMPVGLSLPAAGSAETFVLGDEARADGGRDTIESPNFVSPVVPGQAREPARLQVERARPMEQLDAQGAASIAPQAFRRDATVPGAAANTSTSHEGLFHPASSQAAQPAGAEPEARPQQTTIRISIGRVEVRAVQPTPTAVPLPATRPNPALSLDDYLKGRNEAKR